MKCWTAHPYSPQPGILASGNYFCFNTYYIGFGGSLSGDVAMTPIMLVDNKEDDLIYRATVGVDPTTKNYFLKVGESGSYNNRIHNFTEGSVEPLEEEKRVLLLVATSGYRYDTRVDYVFPEGSRKLASHTFHRQLTNEQRPHILIIVPVCSEIKCITYSLSTFLGRRKKVEKISWLKISEHGTVVEESEEEHRDHLIREVVRRDAVQWV